MLSYRTVELLIIQLYYCDLWLTTQGVVIECLVYTFGNECSSAYDCVTPYSLESLFNKGCNEGTWLCSFPIQVFQEECPEDEVADTGGRLATFPFSPYTRNGRNHDLQLSTPRYKVDFPCSLFRGLLTVYHNVGDNRIYQGFFFQKWNLGQKYFYNSGCELYVSLADSGTRKALMGECHLVKLPVDAPDYPVSRSAVSIKNIYISQHKFLI